MDFLCMIFNTASSATHCVGGCWIEPRTVATTTLAVRRSNHSARSHPHSAKSHPRFKDFELSQLSIAERAKV